MRVHTQSATKHTGDENSYVLKEVDRKLHSATEVGCPTCKVLIGAPCVGLGRLTVHIERQTAAL